MEEQNDYFQRRQAAAADIVRYFTKNKFTVDEAQNILELASRWITAATTVNVDAEAIDSLWFR